MAINVNVGRTLALFSVLIIATAATVRAEDDIDESPSIADTTASQDRAAEAQRLAKQAAALAKQAAALAAEGQAQSAEAAPKREAVAPASTSRRVASRRDADMQSSEIDDQSTPAPPKPAAWRSRRQSQDHEMPIHFDRETLRAAAAADDFPTEVADDQELLSDDGVLVASRTAADHRLRLVNDQEPIPAPPANRRSNNGPDTHSGSVYESGVDGTCNSGCDTGCCNAPCLFWVGGVEATFLKPNFRDNGASIEITDAASERDEFFSTNDHDLDSIYVAPRIWLGVQGCCWGADIKYWQMRAQDGSADASLNSNGSWSGFDCGIPDIGNFSSNALNLYTIDLEVSRRFCVRDDWMQFSMGVRHAEIRHDSLIVANSDLGDTNLMAYARDDSFSQGTGLVFGWYGRRSVYPCSCVNWYYNLHYSVLWGPTATAAETAAQINVSDPGSAGSTNTARTHADDTLLIGEAQLGLEWDYALRCLPANAFFRAGIEFQSWEGGNGSSSANSFAGTSTTVNNVVTNQTEVNAIARTNEPRLDLFGFTLGTGLTW